MARVWKVAAAVLIVSVLGVAAEARPGGRIAAGAPQWKQMMPGVKFAPVYGDWEKGAHGKFVSIDHGAQVPMHGHTNDYEGVLTSGRMANVYGDGQRAELIPGDYFHMPAEQPHSHQCLSEEGCTFYTHSDKSWDILAHTDQAGVGLAGSTDQGGGNSGNANLGSGKRTGKSVTDGAAVPKGDVGETGRDHVIIRTDGSVAISPSYFNGCLICEPGNTGPLCCTSG